MKIGRNDPCPCGSGKKNKNCCEKTGTASDRKWTIIGVVLIVLIVGGAIAALRDASTVENIPPAERVWSEEHGHWHTKRNPQAGPAPAGKVWSEEHGHFHDAPAGTLNTRIPGPPPAGPAPEGKVWSEVHGHWHDAPQDPPLESSAE